MLITGLGVSLEMAVGGDVRKRWAVEYAIVVVVWMAT